MKINKVIVTILILSILPLIASAQKDDKKKQTATQVVTPIIDEGLIYFLPRTGISVKVNVAKKQFAPGPYYKWADKFLGYKDAKGVASDDFDLVSITVEPISEADPNFVYRTTGILASTISLRSDGVITGINTETNVNQSIEIGNDLLNYNELPSIIFPDCSSDEYYDTEINTATGEEKTTYKPEEVKAREAADYLFKIRQKRAFISNSTNDDLPRDGESFNAFLRKSQKMENEYLSLFLGKTFTSEQEFIFFFFPGEESVKNEVLFRFSDDRGVLPKSDISGKPVILEMTKDQKVISEIKKFNTVSESDSESGLFYRVPVYSSIILTDGINQYYSGRILVSQFGIVTSIPEMLLDGNYKIEFDHITGAIKNCSKIKQ
ncbi:MAG: DUF4831 family protein [Prolixibacteraceae bacterium]|nr:DUF4831 family protein [Prolixibacteraceae bacterium]